jgi:ABC-type Mn2+/Zn2+ transport system ATPase subunit
LDEPAQNLDVSGEMQLYKLIQNIHQQQGCAVLMISHDLHRVMKKQILYQGEPLIFVTMIVMMLISCH